MTKRTSILITSAVLLAAVVTAGFLVRNNDDPVTSQTANAPVATGISIVFDAPLARELVATVTDGNNSVVKELSLEKNASRFNIDLPSGVYTVGLKASDNSIPPIAPETITVGEGVLSELHISIPHEEEQ